jgi:hypothetical protein
LGRVDRTVVGTEPPVAISRRGSEDPAWSRTLTIGDSKPLTLKFVFDDCLEHLIHHLEHIGVDVSDLK